MNEVAMQMVADGFFIAFLTILFLFSLFCVVGMFLAFIATWGLLTVSIVRGQNDDGIAAEKFLELLEQAQRDMIVYGDGGKGANTASIYEDQGFCESFKKKLNATPDLDLRICFNFDETTQFMETLADHPRVTIKTLGRTERDRPDNMHYKVIDGQKAYLSRHALGSGERTFRSVDCTGVRIKIVRELVAYSTLGEYIEDFEERFARARVGNAVASAS